MKKLVFVAVVLAMTIGISSTTQAFWDFSKKAKKAEVKNEQAENNMSAANQSVAFKGESEKPKVVIEKETTGSGNKTIIGGAKINAIGTDGSLVASVTFGTSGPIFSLTINTNADTKVYRRYQGKDEKFVLSNISSIAVNDIVSVDGTLDTSVATDFKIVANSIKDYSMQAKDTNYSGVIKTSSINVTDKTFKISLSGGGEMVVSVSNSTKITINGNSKTFDDLMDGMFVVGASGIVNTNTNKLESALINITTIKTIIGRKMNQQVAVVDSVNATTKTMIVDVAGMKYNVFMGQKMQGPDIKIGDQLLKRGFFKWMIVNSIKTSVQVSTLNELELVRGSKIWVTGDLTKTGSTNQVDAYRVEKGLNSL